MRASRITLAATTGALPLPAEGRVAVFRARPEHDLSALPAERLQVIQGFRPHHDALAARGLDCTVAPAGPYCAALVAATRAKAETLGLIATALRLTVPGGWVAVDGQKTDGVDSLLKACRKALPVGEVLSKSHGKLFVIERADALPDSVAGWEAAAAPQSSARDAMTRAGVFSADGLDPGSALLIQSLPGKISGRVADLGAGWGALAAPVLAHTDVTRLDLIEAEHAALEAARANVTDPRAAFHWADATTWRPGAVCDLVISNPPFHQGRAAEPSLGQAFIRSAAAALKPSGEFRMVANRQLPYEEVLRSAFGRVETVTETPAYKVIAAARPRVTAARRRRARDA